MLDQRGLDFLDTWIRSLLWEGEVPFPPLLDTDESLEEAKSSTLEIHRLKGRVVTKEGKQQLIQGVRDVFEIFEPNQGCLGYADGKLVLIGRGLKDVDLMGSLNWFISQGQDEDRG